MSATAQVPAEARRLHEQRVLSALTPRASRWAAFLRNPNAGYWSDPSGLDESAAPGVVRLEWTGPEDNRISVQRRHHGRTLQG
ncbi:hypothetical protein [Streptomyces carpinensis]|uniref:GNAT family N-acetyltransferase n=1 Tax=Streptomyces carpinensis TaxID=66369 RepID=A0ABV1VZD9_9ACTN|nr:hypothetical protein [Streptomyces carpinensis]